MLTRDWWSGWRFRSTTLSEEYTLENFLEERGEDIDILIAKRPDGTLDFLQPDRKSKSEGSTILSFGAVLNKTPEKTQDRGEGATTSAPQTSDGSMPLVTKGELPS